RDTEIEDLKTQLSRMQEDWIEEECHRVEAQLALKEARKEIKQLKQVIDTVKNNLLEKDKGLQKYFVDINIQNKKLETLLHSMEVAQNGVVKEEGAGESAGGSPARSLTRSSTYTKLSDQAAGDRNVGDSQTLTAEEMADRSRTDLLEQSSLLSSGVEFCTEEGSLQNSFTLGSRLPTSSTYEKLLGVHGSVEAGVQASCMQEQAIQTDFVHYQPDLDTILEKVTSQACSLGSPTSVWVSEMDSMATDPHSVMVVSAGDGTETLAPEGYPGAGAHNPASARRSGPSVSVACPLEEDVTELSAEATVPKSYWSRYFIVDLLAVVVPAVPTVAWLCRTQRRQGQPLYNISSLLRGCCTVALHSLRKISWRPLRQPIALHMLRGPRV
uniref:Syntaphilin n=1 Tax=Pelodiscus sinensis TaxID=13735 RepID=K7FTN9_PELSI